MSNKKVPITRISKFFGSEDFALEQSIGMEWLHGDMHFTLVLFRVDKKLSDVDDVYGEAGKEEIRYKAPVEIKGYVDIAEAQNKSYASGLVNQMEPGNLTFSVYMKHLGELDVDINYGDYIGYNETEETMRYYVVVDDGRVTSDNIHTIGGYKAFYRTIKCSFVSENEFDGI
jgi:hypothetical protein|tara:strand:- start:20637 stop:21152 length:516 start_codon:yes stop_codon:yes gene_type:complete